MKYFKKKQKNNTGFTLIEILVIIAIIGVLMGAILVSLAPIRERSEVNSLMRTMGTVIRAAGACDIINQQVYPPMPSGQICNTPLEVTVTYPIIDPKLSSKGYEYLWKNSDTLIGIKDNVSNVLIECNIGSGTCESL